MTGDTETPAGVGMVNSLAGRHAAVTGGNRGIGAAIAAALVRLGASVTLLARDAASLESAAAGLVAEGGTVGWAPLDLGEPESISTAFAKAAAERGPLSILVNNAGVAISAPFMRTDLELWNRIMGVDLTGAFLCTQAVLPGMLEQRWGRIVNVASTAGLKGIAYVTAYCAAKHGLIGLTRSLAIETARKGVTVNAVCPGYTDTDIARHTIDNIVAKTGCTPDEALASITHHNPQGRLIQPREVADAVAWLCLPSSASITGQSVPVAGGEIM